MPPEHPEVGGETSEAEEVLSYWFPEPSAQAGDGANEGGANGDGANENEANGRGAAGGGGCMIVSAVVICGSATVSWLAL
jgi:hypothetical protein